MNPTHYFSAAWPHLIVSLHPESDGRVTLVLTSQTSEEQMTATFLAGEFHQFLEDGVSALTDARGQEVVLRARS